MAHPIVGDTTYGDRRHNRLFREQFEVYRLLLIAKRMRFLHPVSGRVIEVEADNGMEFDNAISALKQHKICLLYTSPSPRDQRGSRMPSSA